MGCFANTHPVRLPISKGIVGGMGGCWGVFAQNFKKQTTEKTRFAKTGCILSKGRNYLRRRLEKTYFLHLDERFSHLDERFSHLDGKFSHLDESFRLYDGFSGFRDESLGTCDLS